MKVELIAIGDELISGGVQEQNSRYLAGRLLLMGVKPMRFSVLPDDRKLLKEGLCEALKRADLVVCSGGLGPTVDDHTRAVIAELFESPMTVDTVVFHELERRYGKELLSLQDQATVPSKSQVLLNTIGTAPGLLFQEKQGALIALPGVPSEFRCLCDEQVLPWIEKNQTLPTPLKRAMLSIGGVSESDVDPLLRNIQQGYSALQVGIYPQLGWVNVQLAAPTEELLEIALSELKAGFGDRVFFSQRGSVEDALQVLMVQKGETLACAESCTGGKIAQLVTSIPGASSYFLGSVVAYSNACKEELLGVSSELLERYGAVSEPVVEAMVKGILQKTGADWGVASSGVAGPAGGTVDKPVGMVCGAVGKRGENVLSWTKVYPRSNREMIASRSATEILFKLYQMGRSA